MLAIMKDKVSITLIISVISLCAWILLDYYRYAHAFVNTQPLWFAYGVPVGAGMLGLGFSFLLFKIITLKEEVE